ncbi:MAG: HDOD domain-containing protein [Acidimicrobiales bacterium]
MLNLLFVGVEPTAIDAGGDRWDLHLVRGVDDALRYLDEFEPDAVVTALDLADGDAIALLGTLVVERPGTVRLLVAAEHDIGRDRAGRAIGLTASRVAHQVLMTENARLVPARRVEEAVALVAAARGAVTPDRIRDLVGQIDELPTLGSVYVELTEAMEKASASNATLGEIVAQDTALTAELLRVVNSAFFGLSRQVDTTAQAVGFLGLDVVRAVVAAHSLFDVDRSGVVDVRAVVHHSQSVAALARRIQLHRGASHAEGARAFLAGMLHEVGVLVLAELPHRSSGELAALLARRDVTAERLACSADRYSVGGYLLALWAFPPDVVEAVTLLGAPLDPEGRGLAWSLRLAQEIALADGLVRDGTLDGNEEASRIDDLDATLRSRGYLPAGQQESLHLM